MKWRSGKDCRRNERNERETPLSENDPSRRQFLVAGLQIAASLPSCFSRPAPARGKNSAFP